MPILIWILAVASVTLWGVGIWCGTHPEIVGRGQDPAGKGMAAGCSAIFFCGLGTIAAVVVAIIVMAQWHALVTVSRVVGLTPAAGIALFALVSWAVTQSRRAARRREARQEQREFQAIVTHAARPEALLSALFHAFTAKQPTRWQQLFQGVEALRWQFPNYAYRSALISIHLTDADAADPELANLLNMFQADRPAGNVLVFGPDAAAVEGFAKRVRDAGWPVETLVVPAGEDWAWIDSLWLPKALELAGPGPDKPAPFI